MKIDRINIKFLLLSLTSAFGYVVCAYLVNRSNFLELMGLYSGLFLAFYFLLSAGNIKSKFLFGTGVLFRLLILFAIPNLSQDFYRFIWDGRILLQGLNPYLYLPDNLVTDPTFHLPEALELYKGMGSLSSGHFTNYPPLNQFCFGIAALFSGKNIFGSVVIFKIIILLSDVGIYYFGKKLLSRLNLPKKNIYYYFLNPLVIIELSGNLHFEGVMIFFLIWSLHLLQNECIKRGAIVFAFSVAVKLIPLIFLPLLFRQLKFRKAVEFYGIVGIAVLLLFLPFYSPAFINNYSATVSLWFTNFEFNASIYYLVRSIGYWLTGFNQIHIIGKIAPFVILGGILIISFSKENIIFKNTITNMLLAICIYFFLSTTVHPWYIITPLALSVFTRFRFPVIWSFLIMLSYYAYSNTAFKENQWLLMTEYGIVYFAFLWEFFYKRPLPLYKSQINLSGILTNNV